MAESLGKLHHGRLAPESVAMPAPCQVSFDYHSAFVRNLGWLTAAEQQSLRHKTVAIAGLGGVGGAHAVTLARLGIGGFRLADFDVFELANFNRQAGAFVSTIGSPKVDAIAATVRDINPECAISSFSEGVTAANLESFLDGVDLVVDGLDFFVLDARRSLFARSRELGIPVVTAAPLGMGTAYLVFTSDGMSFEDYFRLDGPTQEKRSIQFMVGLAPRGLHRPALVDLTRVDFANEKGPSTPMGCQMASSVVGAEAVKLLLGRGAVRPAPYYHQFDPYVGRFVTGKLRWGNAGPLQRVKVRLAEHTLQRLNSRFERDAERNWNETSPLRRILDLARWAPSGDNEQPWRFELLGEDRIRIHVRPPDPENPYEFDDGRPIWLSVGGLLETLSQAASIEGRQCHWSWTGETSDPIQVRFLDSPRVGRGPLADVIGARQVDRRPYRSQRLSAAQKARLEAAAGSEFEITWRETAREKWQATRLNSVATRARLTEPKCHAVHRRVIRFDGRYVDEGLPAHGIGLDPLSVQLMRWVNPKWWRTRLVNGWLGGALLASVQLDVLPGMMCGGHFSLTWRAPAQLRTRHEWLRAGMAMQRFWLQASVEGLVVQPGFAPLIFAHRAETGQEANFARGPRRAAAWIRKRLPEVFGAPRDIACLGRIGRAKAKSPGSRSLRKPLDDLIIPASK